MNTYLNEKIDLTYFKNACSVFEKFRKNLNSDQEKAGAIKAFEFCYELAWKLMKRVLVQRGLESGSPKDTFRKAFKENLISDPEIWFELQKKINLTMHSYSLKNLDIIIDSFEFFSNATKELIKKIEEDQ